MLPDGSNNLAMTMEWEGPVRRGSGNAHRLEQGYSQDDITNGFRLDIATSKTSMGDRVKMIWAATLALLVPALFAFILLVSTLIWVDFTVQLVDSYDETKGAGLALAIFGVGNLLLFSFIAALVRRLVIIGCASKNYLEVSEQSQPELHAFVNRIAKLLNGPKPVSVKLDAEVGLMLRPSSLRGAILGAAPELVIGLPLLYGLSARQLSGVIAHAYAGYSRDASLHGYSILCSVDRWFYIQTGLSRGSSVGGEYNVSGQSWIGRVLKPFDFAVQGSFFLIYRIISSLTFVASRKVDMVGDLFSARVAGSTEFRSTQFRLRSLHYGQAHANQELVKVWRTKKLPDNFPALVVDHADTLQLSLRPRLIREMEELVTPLTRSRIVDLGRIINVEHTQEEGACFLLGSAIALLRDPAKVSRDVTIKQYQHQGIENPDVYASQKVQSLQKAELEKAKRREVFCGLESSGRVIRIDEFETYSNQAQQSLLHDYLHLQKKLQANQAQIGPLSTAVAEYEFRKNLMNTRKVMGECKGAGDLASRELEVQWLTLIKEQSEYKTRLATHESMFSRRAAIGLALAMDNQEVPARLQMSPQEMHSHFLRLVDALNFLYRCFESVQRLRSYTQVLGQILVEHANNQRQTEMLPQMSARYQKYLLIELESLMKVLGGVAYPLGGIGFAASARAQDADLLTIGEVVQFEVADLDSASTCPEACHRVANAVCQYLEGFNQQLQERVTAILSAVEASFQNESVAEPR